MNESIVVENKGQEILNSNYWNSSLAARGAIFLSINAGALRLLVPDSLLSAVSDMRSGREVVVSRGPWPAKGAADAIEVLFDDHTQAPFSLTIGTNQIDRLPSTGDHGREFRFAVWTRGPRKVWEAPAYFRVVAKLPCMEPWEA